MTVNLDQRPDGRTGPTRRTGGRGRLAFAVLLPIVLILVVAAGFTHPWNAGSGLAAGSYRRDYSITQQYQDPDIERCVTLTLSGTMSARYSSPVWSLGGPGWTAPALDDTRIETRITESCAADALPVTVNSAELSQFWATETCADPQRGDSWRESSRLGRCDQDLVAGVRTKNSSSSDHYSASYSGIEPLTWKGTVYGDSVCVNGTAAADVLIDDGDAGIASTAVFDGYQVCLDPGTAEQA